MRGDDFTKLPLCTICVKSGLLCPRCQRLVERGDYDDIDIEIMKILLELEESKFTILKDVVYYKSYKADNMYVIVLSGNKLSPYMLGKIAKKLSEKLEGKVRIIEKTGSLRRMASQLLLPANVLGVNILWLPDGSWQSIVRVSKSDSKALPAEKEVLEEILTKLSGMEVRIRFE
ncbi:MAG: transcription elongation factor NusA [Thermoprotei archaeon]|nr:MAG: transcription elongation factor NusA [Thermoprotei archaeon]